MAIGINKIEVIALAALGGSLINLPMSCYLTSRLGVAGVIWGTVLTTFFSNLLVPGLYVFRVLEIDPRTYLKRTLSPPLAGALALVAATWLLRQIDAGQLSGRRSLDPRAALALPSRRRHPRLHRRLSDGPVRSQRLDSSY